MRIFSLTQTRYFIIFLFVVTFAFASNVKLTSKRQVFAPTQRIDCYPDSESPYSNYSKTSCLARNCLFDDLANVSTIQCYLPNNYGYVLQSSINRTNGIQFKLKRNGAIGSMFPDPIENVTLEIQYYTNDIIRFKLYDSDQRRYEVGDKEAIENENHVSKC